MTTARRFDAVGAEPSAAISAGTLTTLTDDAIVLDDLGGSIVLDDVYLPEDR